MNSILSHKDPDDVSTAIADDELLDYSYSTFQFNGEFIMDNLHFTIDALKDISPDTICEMFLARVQSLLKNNDINSQPIAASDF